MKQNCKHIEIVKISYRLAKEDFIELRKRTDLGSNFAKEKACIKNLVIKDLI